MPDAKLSRKAPNILQQPRDLRPFPMKSSGQVPSQRPGIQLPGRHALVLVNHAWYARRRRVEGLSALMADQS